MRFSLIAIFSLLLAAADGVTQAERDKAIAYLTKTQKWYEQATANLTDEQWKYKPAPDRWSVAECAEHIAFTEDLIYTILEKKLQAPPEPRKESPEKRDSFLVQAMPNRTRRANAPEEVRPTGRFASQKELNGFFDKTRRRTLDFITTTQADLRAHTHKHFAFGDLDVYQWVLLLAGHSDRHLQQLEEVKATPGFPK